MKSTKMDLDKLERGPRLSHIEDDLRIILRPVKPRPTYISESKLRLIKATQQERSWLAVIQLLVMAMAFAASVVFILVLSIRTTITLLGTLGLVRLVKEEARRKSAILAAGSPIMPAPTRELLR